MTGFAVIRHTETGGMGTAPAEGMELLLANGWVRVSEYRPDPAMFHPPDFADAPDLDAPTEDPEPDPEPATPAQHETEE